MALAGDEIYVLDRQVPVVRVYDLEGVHLRDIGNEGDGPGELRRPDDLAIGPDGRLFVRDSGTGRINILSPTGEPLGTIPIESSFSTSTQMVMADDGTLFNYQRTNPGGDVGDWGMAMVPRSEDGEDGDPIFPPEFDFEPWQLEARSENSASITNVPFSPSVTWALAPARAVVAGLTDSYRFEVHHRDGRVTVVEKSWDPVPVDDDEAEWQRQRTIENLRRVDPAWVWSGPGIPDNKPAFSILIPDHSGRVWVVRPGPADYDAECESDDTVPCWRSERLVDVFDLEGRFLGAVDVPEEVQVFPRPFIEADTVLGAYMDRYGTIMVKRFRLVLP